MSKRLHTKTNLLYIHITFNPSRIYKSNECFGLKKNGIIPVQKSRDFSYVLRHQYVASKYDRAQKHMAIGEILYKRPQVMMRQYMLTYHWLREYCINTVFCLLDDTLQSTWPKKKNIDPNRVVRANEQHWREKK